MPSVWCEPCPLPTPRPRRLSLRESPLDAQLEKPNFDQAQSFFFSRLPLELRRLCYTQALCEPEGTLHVYPRASKYGYIKCQQPGELCHRGCWKLLQTICSRWDHNDVATWLGAPADASIDTSALQKTISINLLIACRRVYIEAIDLLYEVNAFSFNSGRSLTAFLLTVLPHRFNAIRQLSLNRSFYLFRWETKEPPQPYNSQGGSWSRLSTWNTLCSRISEMPHLRQLRCSLGVVEPNLTSRFCKKQFSEFREKEFLDPLKQITRPNQFEVVLRWEQLPNSITKNEDFPFTVIWGDESTTV